MLVANLVHQISVSTGTGNFTLAAANGKQSFDTAFGHGTALNAFPYFISNRDASEYEWGIGHMSDASTLVRDTVNGGSNGTNPVNFSAGTKDVTSAWPAETQYFPLTPQQFGAKGNGVADDTAALATFAAAYASTGREAYVPDGVYLTSQQVQFLVPPSTLYPPPTLRFGTNAVIRATAPISGGLVVFGSNASDFSGIIRGGTVQGGVFDANNLADVGLHIAFADNCTVFNCQAFNTKLYGFKAGSVSAPQRSYGVVFDQCKTNRIGAAKNITGITKANPGVVTCAGHGFSTGDKITITSVVGMTQVNNLTYTITVVDANSFSIGVDTTAFSAYTSGGIAYSGYAPVGSASIYFENCGDSHAISCMLTGSQIGLTSNDGFWDGKLTNNHVWNFLFNGEVLYGFDVAGDNCLVGNQVDGPFQYAFRFTGLRNSLIAPNVDYTDLTYGGKDNYAYPVRIETGGGVDVESPNWKAVSSSARLAAAVSGDISNYSSRRTKYLNFVIAPVDTTAEVNRVNTWTAKQTFNQGGTSTEFDITSGTYTFYFIQYNTGVSALSTNGSIQFLVGSSFTQALRAFASTGIRIGSLGADPGALNLGVDGSIASAAPVTKTGTSSTVGASDSSIIFNASGAHTVTLPSPATYPGRWLTVKSIAAQAISSASANVVPLAGGAAGTALLASGAGKWASLQSDGTNWVVMAGN